MAVTAALLFISPTVSDAQFGIRVNINLQPQWGPADYDYVEYYYMPEYDIYYYAPERQFIFRVGSQWVFSRTLPYQYRHVDLYSTYKVVINESKPYLRHKYYSTNYGQYRHARSKQEIIRDSRRPRQDAMRDHNDNRQMPANRNVGKETHDNNKGNKKSDNSKRENDNNRDKRK